MSCCGFPSRCSQSRSAASRVPAAPATSARETLTRRDRDIVDQASATEMSGRDEARPAVEAAHRQKMGGIAQFEVTGAKPGLRQSRNPFRQPGGALAGAASGAGAVVLHTPI